IHAEKLSFKKKRRRQRTRPCRRRPQAGTVDKISEPDGEAFRTYAERVLIPTLAPGDIVILDNLGSHKGKAVRRLIRSAGAKLFFLPKYSPDLNPIEQVFAKLKHLLRKIAARTVDDVCAAIGQILGAFAPAECANYFRNS